MVDVVRDPAAHQVNLRPPVHPTRTAVLALPRPALCRRLVPDVFAARRAAELASLAAEVGGGDGPAPIVDLEEGTVEETLAGLGGVRRLVVYGAVDQPGFARAIACRWPGGLELRGSLLSPLMDDPAPVVWLAPDVARVSGGPRPDARVVLTACVDGPQGTHPYALDPSRTRGPWSGCVPPRGAHAPWAEVFGHEVVRDAVLGLDPELERRLAPPRDARAPIAARVYVVTGMDGSGKSTHARRLADTLEARGVRTAVLKIYRQGAFLELADELSGRTRRGAPLSNFRLSRVVKLVDSLRALRDAVLPAGQACGALVMDRYLETHIAAAETQLGWDLRAHAALRAFPPADRVCWLELPFGQALARLADRGERLSADEHPAGLAGYAESFAAQAGGPGHLRLDARAPFAANAASIAAHVLDAAPPGGRAVDVPIASAPSRPRPGPTRVVVGRFPDRPQLGAGVLALRALVDAAAVPEQLWIEAYAAQLVLDLRAGAPDGACVPVWPAALRRLWPDLESLAELTRLLEAEAEVESWTPEPGPFFESFCAVAAARRLAEATARATRDVALADAWPA